ncbi:hypothetical protein [Spirosoma montaniterrae]|nr:hypothetical protein [Spirosoma montaniterrae]
MLDSLLSSLHTFANNYQAVMWRLRECALNDEQLGAALGVSGNAIRNRRAKPDLWKLSDVERLASHFSLPTTACTHLDRDLKEFPNRLRSMPPDERRRMERLLLLKIAQFESYNKNDWPVRYLLRMHRALLNGS